MVYNPSTNRFETYFRSLYDRMPYSKYLYVYEFKGSSKSDVLWIDKRLIEAFDNLRKSYGRPIPVKFAFKRIYEGGHSNQSQHYAGMALDMGQGLTDYQRSIIRSLAINSREFYIC